MVFLMMKFSPGCLLFGTLFSLFDGSSVAVMASRPSLPDASPVKRADEVVQWRSTVLEVRGVRAFFLQYMKSK